MYVHMYASYHIYIDVHVQIICADMKVYINVYTYNHVSKLLYMSTCIHIDIHQINVYACVLHTHIYIYT